MTMFESFATTPALLLTSVFALSLLVGSFLNVVIHRLPIMLDRQWRAQARETLAEPADSGAPAEPADSAEPVDAAEPADSVEGTDSTGHHAAAAPSPGSLTPASAQTQPSDEAPYNLVVPRSACPHCGAAIKAHQNIPVLSYLMLGGRCANCRARISLRYPVVELATALLSTAVAWRYGWHWQTLAALVLTWALIALTVIDHDHQILPDAITLPLLWLGLLLALAWHADLRPTIPANPASAIAGAVAGYLVLWLVYWAFKLLTGKEGMGYGDFKLLGALGAWMGWQMLPLIILLSAFTGAVVGLVLIALRGRDRSQPMPFGPYLAAAGWIAMMWGPQIMGAYLRFTGL
jgi:leader peptidase (prepilin peptidase) / N-methyltransferase